MIQTKYFLDPICGYGNMVDVYIENRLPEIIDKFNSKEDAIKYICENEVYLFNYKNEVDTLEAKLFLKRYNAFNTHVYFIDWKEDRKNVNDYFKLIEQKLVEENFKNIDESGMPKFDYIIQNPPYKGSLHLSFLEEGLNMLSKTGKMIIIEPSTWLINLRTNGKAKSIYIPLKKKIEGHVKSVVIENLNREFNIGLYLPLSITTIDMEHKYDTINFTCCGENKIVNSIYDCNLIGNYNLVQSILNKCLSYQDMMKQHTTNKNIDNNKYLRYSSIITAHGYNSKVDYIKTINGIFYGMFITPCIHKDDNDIKTLIPLTKAGNAATCVYGNEIELKNWKYFALNNKLPLFINMCLTFDQHNNSELYIPWLVDKQRTDKEIYKLFNFTKEEIKLIENTIKKFERSSNWFKRKCEGKDWKKYCKEF